MEDDESEAYLNNFIHIIVVPLWVDATVGGVRRGVRGADPGWWVVNHVFHYDPLDVSVASVAGSGRELRGACPLHHDGGRASRFIALLLSKQQKQGLLFFFFCSFKLNAQQL